MLTPGSVRHGAHLLQVVKVEELAQLLVELGLGQCPVVQELHPVRLHLKPKVKPLLNTIGDSENTFNLSNPNPTFQEL